MFPVNAAEIPQTVQERKKESEESGGRRWGRRTIPEKKLWRLKESCNSRAGNQSRQKRGPAKGLHDRKRGLKRGRLKKRDRTQLQVETGSSGK